MTDFEWHVIEPLLPNRPRGITRVDDRCVLNGIFLVLRSGASWQDLPYRYGAHTTCYNRFVRCRKAGAWDRLLDAIYAARDATIHDRSTSIRAHQRAATAKAKARIIEVSIFRLTPFESLPRNTLAGARRSDEFLLRAPIELCPRSLDPFNIVLGLDPNPAEGFR